MRRLFTLLISCLVMISGCAQFSVGTMWSLRDTDMMTVDARVARLALALPEGATFAEATLTLQFARAGTTLIDHSIHFEVITSGAEVQRVGFPEHLANQFVLRVPPARVDDVVAFQRTIISEREQGTGASMSVGVHSRLNPEWIEEYCAGENAPIRISAWVLVNDAEGYLPLFGDSELGKLLNAQTENVCL